LAETVNRVVAICVMGLALGAALLPGCGADSTPDGAKGRDDQRGERREAHDVILSWLECEECMNGELQAVVDLGPDVVPLLIATLRDGPSPASRARLELQLRDRYQRLQVYRERHPDRPEASLETSFDEFVAHHDNDARYRGRAALALGRIGTPAAESALSERSTVERRPSVKKAIRDALAAIEAARSKR
jgi:hypothetical protein